jgi:hypothetical protein
MPPQVIQIRAARRKHVIVMAQGFKKPGGRAIPRIIRQVIEYRDPHSPQGKQYMLADRSDSGTDYQPRLESLAFLQ